MKLYVQYGAVWYRTISVHDYFGTMLLWYVMFSYITTVQAAVSVNIMSAPIGKWPVDVSLSYVAPTITPACAVTMGATQPLLKSDPMKKLGLCNHLRGYAAGMRLGRGHWWGVVPSPLWMGLCSSAVLLPNFFYFWSDLYLVHSRQDKTRQCWNRVQATGLNAPKINLAKTRRYVMWVTRWSWKEEIRYRPTRSQSAGSPTQCNPVPL